MHRKIFFVIFLDFFRKTLSIALWRKYFHLRTERKEKCFQLSVRSHIDFNNAIIFTNDFLGGMNWFRNNVWSIVFLSVGTLSLIGIIILLFIKPKEEVETDETGEALNVNAKK